MAATWWWWCERMLLLLPDEELEGYCEHLVQKKRRDEARVVARDHVT